MKTTPILFQDDMVRALRANLKTQTRRTRGLEEINEAPDKWRFIRFIGDIAFFRSDYFNRFQSIKCPYGGPSDILWTRETYTTNERVWDDDKAETFMVPATVQGLSFFRYRADGEIKGARWRPSIHMPRVASRDTLEITELRCQRVQEITEEDARAEGCEPRTAGHWDDGEPIKTYRTGYVYLWNSINGKRVGYSWTESPWVWAITFRRVSNG